ncbi:thiamine-phosphate pyrophosphorylase [Phycisphaerales bacterium]|nr:thiamine-phosphate pyrophosphorylase [Phycisphaerales bacterium]
MHNAYRILDANLNRAREAARVLEDLARFVLNRADLCENAKLIRHDLAAAARCLDPHRLVASRDTGRDVGTTISTPAEYRRDSTLDLIRANAARLSEALRTIEETAKSLGAAGAEHVGRPIESIRYRAYTLEKDLLLAFGAASRRQWRLCVILTECLCRGPWLDIARAAMDGGADCLQLREKNLDSRELLDRAEVLVSIAHPRAVSVVINDRPDIALLTGADGVHVGQTDMEVHDARRIVGGLLIGVSTENPDQARRARLDGADYCGLGPMFATTTKEKPRLAGPGYVRAYLADPSLGDLPHLAIGGINSGNIRDLAAAGCMGVAVSSAVCASDDPARECARLVEALGGRGVGRH